MRAYDYITTRQGLWAARQGHRLGSQFRNSPDPKQRERGRKFFVFDLEDNLFEPLTEEARRAFEAGDGGELFARRPGEGNMYALHSSSAAATNLFHYWCSRGDLAPILRACKLPTANAGSLEFEAKFPIVEDDPAFPKHPNLDVAIRYTRGSLQVVGIECKLTEPYGREHSGLANRYLTLPLWSSLPSLLKLAREISPDDGRFRHFHAAQVLKHILGLSANHGRDSFRLLYLWCAAPGDEACGHRAEVDEFAAIARADGVDFGALTYQEVIARLASVRDGHRAYVDYLADRYL